MPEFDCKRCHIHVVPVIDTAPAEADYCVICRFIVSIEDPESRAEAEDWDDRHRYRPGICGPRTEGAADAS